MVVDSTGARVAGAEVVARSAAQSSSSRTKSDGSFEIPISPPATVTATDEGLSARTVAWNGEAEVTLTLAPATVKQDVVVTATRTALPMADVAASISLLSPAEMENSAPIELDDVLRQVPGFSLFRRTNSRTANPTAQGVSLRGLGASGASRSLVLFDGVPLNDPFGGWVYWDRIPSTDIHSVEVLRGGGSALYGSGALAGVVSIAPEDLRERALSLDLSGGQQGTANGSASVFERMGGWALGASAQAMRTDGYVPVPVSLRGRADAPANVRFGAGRFRIDRDFSRARIFASVNLFNESRQNGTVLQRNDTRLVDTTLGADVGAGGGTVSLRIYALAQHFDQTFSSVSLDRNSESLVRVQAVPAQQFGISAEWTRPLGSHNTIAIGGDFRRVTGHSDEVLWARNAPTGTVDAGGRQIYAGGFIEDLVRLGSRLHINASARADSWRNYDAISRAATFVPALSSTTRFPDRTQAALSPSLGGAFRVTNWLSLTGSAYGAFRSPSLNELYRAFRLGNVLTQANDALHPERLRGVDAGVTVTTTALSVRATYFWNTIHDAIGNRTLSTTPALITRQRQNIGDILARGIELEVAGHLPRHINTRTSYEYADSIVSRSLEAALYHLRVPQVPRHAVSQMVWYDARRWSASIAGRYNGLQFDDDVNQFPLPGYFTADVMLRVRVARDVEPYIACENLLDREYMVGRTPTPTLGSPRLFRAGIRILWNGDRRSRP